MPDALPVFLTGAVEGIVDEAVLVRLVKEGGARLHAIHGRNGKPDLLRNLSGYNHAARVGPWVVLVDLNSDADCAPPFVARALPAPSPLMRLRVAVREVEAWLLADQDRLADFLGLPANRIPADPDSLADPKRSLVDLARGSRRRDIREDMVPRSGSGRPVGPAYASRLIEFASSRWRPASAARSSDSLRRCRRRIRELVSTSRQGISR